MTCNDSHIKGHERAGRCQSERSKIDDGFVLMMMGPSLSAFPLMDKLIEALLQDCTSGAAWGERDSTDLGNDHG
jgi:hypothetical protein